MEKDANTQVIGYGYKRWVLMLNGNVNAPATGLYIFAIRNDNHISFELLTLEEGQNIWDKFNTVYPNEYPSEKRVIAYEEGDWYIPLAFHYIPFYQKGSKYWKEEDESEQIIINHEYWSSNLKVEAIRYDNKVFYCLENYFFADNIYPFAYSLVPNAEYSDENDDYFKDLAIKGYSVLANHQATKFTEIDHLTHWDLIDNKYKEKK